MFKQGEIVKMTLSFGKSTKTTKFVKIHSIVNKVIYVSEADLTKKSKLMFNQKGKEINDKFDFNICQISKVD